MEKEKISDHYFIDDDEEKIKVEDFSKWFNNKFKRLSSGQDSLVSHVILHHLIIERHIEIYIQKNNPNLGDIKDKEAHFTFIQKLSLIKTKDEDETVKNLLPGIRKINEIRNKYSHNLGHKVTLDNLKPLIDYLASDKADRKILLKWGLKSILSSFSLICCSVLQMGSMKLVRPNLIDKLISMREKVDKSKNR